MSLSSHFASTAVFVRENSVALWQRMKKRGLAAAYQGVYLLAGRTEFFFELLWLVSTHNQDIDFDA